ncbi:hypothetical protein MMC13_005790 [Lambiella insularis]|nr:hypothetical protein [Lambiella insularis]
MTFTALPCSASVLQECDGIIVALLYRLSPFKVLLLLPFLLWKHQYSGKTKLPSILPAGLVPGASNRRDDFTAVHINQTFGVHLDAVFLGWHRSYVWLYENALREECGYNGYQPYWDWTKSVNNISAYTLFDGSEYSIGGDGIYNNSTGDYNLGPIPISALFNQELPSNWTQLNNHCLRRDSNVPVAQRVSNATAVAHCLPRRTLASFSRECLVSATAPPGPHTAGHLQIGMDMFDVFSSPNDPAFFFHHSNVDRMWTIWQARDPLNRQFALMARFSTTTRQTPR